MQIQNKISFILPVYNTNITQVNECLDSIFFQDKDFIEEIILVDDASDNEYKEKLKKIISLRQNKGCNIFLVESDYNRGPTNSRKLGYEKSKGTIIVFIDSDDILINKNFCKEICSTFNKNEKLDLIRFNWIKFRSNKNLNNIMLRKGRKEGRKTSEETSYEFVYNIDFIANCNWWMSVWQFAFKRTIFERCNELLNNNLNQPFEDVYFSFILASNEFKALQIDKIYYGYRFPNKNSFLWKIAKKDKKNHIYLLETLNLWMTSFDTYNLNEPKMYDMWIMSCTPYVIFYGYKKMKKQIDNFPKKEEIRHILQKYKFRKNKKCFHFLLNLNLKFKLFDLIVPQFVRIGIFIKQKIFRI